MSIPFHDAMPRERKAGLCAVYVPLRELLDGRPVLRGRPVPTDGLARSLGPGAGPSWHQEQHWQPIPGSGSVVL